MDRARIEALRNPLVFPERPETVELLQTHLSVVCLAGDTAYKLKKSIRLPFADFSTLERRRHFCEEELRLNRRLCPEIYREVIPLRRGSDEALKFSSQSEGEIVDYAVRMRRLPADRMLDELLEKGPVKEREVEKIAALMIAFHTKAERGGKVSELGSPERLRDFALANFAETGDQVGEGGIFPERLHQELEKRTRADFERWLPRMKKRALSGRVVDGHGDLHARNICLTDPPAIYDCVEFEPGFRCGDVATEHAFLIMDLRYRGHPELAEVYLNAVIDGTGDGELRELIPFLLRYRAMVRAKVSVITAGESELSETARRRAAESARGYLRLAAALAVEETGPWWLMFCGLPASGKSSIANALNQSSGGAWPVLSSDRIRKELAGVAPTAPLPEAFYEADFSRRTYDELRRRSREAMPKRAVVVLDANFREREERALTWRAARSAGARLAILRVEADEATVTARLDRRTMETNTESDADLAVYQRLVTAYQPPESREADLLLTVSGESSPTVAAEEILSALINRQM